MKIILLEEVRSLGHKYDVKEVSDGYARNFLFANKLAKPATAGAIKELEALKNKVRKNEAELLKHLEGAARKLRETALEFTLKTDAAGSVFGSVTKEMILKALRNHELVRKEHVGIELERPLKELGEYKIPVELGKGIVSEIKIVVRPEQQSHSTSSR